MKFKTVVVLFLVPAVLCVGGCAKEVDPKRPIDKIQKEVIAMPVAELESRAAAYAAAIRGEKAEIMKIQQRIQRMPVEKFFSDKSLTRKISEIGRTAEALFERYGIYVKAFQEKGGDPAKVQIELPKK